LEEQLGLELPAELAECMRRHNGADNAAVGPGFSFPGGFHLIDAAGMAANASVSMTVLRMYPESHGYIWHEAWIPFAEVNGTVYAWGDDGDQQIGNLAAGQNQTTPLQVSISGVVGIGAGGTFAMAIKTDGTVWDWGDNNTGQLGDGAICWKTCPTPVQATGLTNTGWITGGYVHSLAETTDGSVYGWGSNSNGQLGNGTTTAAITPTLVTGVIAKH
jgi:hypothetical protein